MKEKKEIRLRLDGVSLDETQKSKVPNLFGGDVNVTFEDARTYRDLRLQHQARMDLIKRSFMLIAAAMPPTNIEFTPEMMEAYLAFAEKECPLPANGDIYVYRPVLAKYTALLVNAIQDFWIVNPSKIADAIDLLNSATDFQNMLDGRADLATLSADSFNGESGFLLQWESYLPPCPPETLAELQAIRDFKGPVESSAFDTLSNAKRLYLHQSSEKIRSLSQLKSDVNELEISWIKAKAMGEVNVLKLIASYSIEFLHQNITGNLDEKAWYRKLEPAEKTIMIWYQRLAPSHRAFITELAKAGAVKVDQELKEMQTLVDDAIAGNRNAFLRAYDELPLLRKLPFWFLSMNKWIQGLVRYCTALEKPLEEIFSTLSSKLRDLPMPANLAKHYFSVLTPDLAPKHSFEPRLKSSHVGSRDVRKQAASVGSKHTYRNYQTVKSFADNNSGPFGMLSLISPLRVTDLLDKPDLYLDAQRANLFYSLKQNDENLVSANLPLNLASMVTPTSNSNEDCQHWLNMAKMALATWKNTGQQSYASSSTAFSAVSPERIENLERLTQDFEALLGSGFGTSTVWDKKCRELFLASYLSLINIYLGGTPWFFCVSGKDRAGCLSLHIDAMLRYHQRFGCWPNINDTGPTRQRFVDILVKLYLSGHAHVSAAQNAAGCAGLKHPTVYLPKDAQAQILEIDGASALRTDDQLATYNELKEIKDMKNQVKPGRAHSIISALRLCPSQALKIVELTKLIANKEGWGKKTKTIYRTTGTAPRGILDIREVLRGELGLGNVQALAAELYFKVNNRPEISSARDPETQTLYSCLRRIEKHYEICTLTDKMEPGKLYLKELPGQVIAYYVLSANGKNILEGTLSNTKAPMPFTSEMLNLQKPLILAEVLAAGHILPFDQNVEQQLEKLRQVSLIPLCDMKADQLSRSNAQRILNITNILVEEAAFWSQFSEKSPRMFPAEPKKKGIPEMRELLKENAALEPSKIMSKLFYTVMSQASIKTTRALPKQTVYDCFRSLFAAQDPNTVVDKVIIDLERLSRNAFAHNSSRRGGDAIYPCGSSYSPTLESMSGSRLLMVPGSSSDQ